MRTFEQQLDDYIESMAAKFSDHPDLIGCNDSLNGYLCYKRGAELLLPMVVDLYNAACEIKYQCARTYGTTDVGKISDLSPVMPLALVLKEIESIQKKIEVQK